MDSRVEWLAYDLILHSRDQEDIRFEIDEKNIRLGNFTCTVVGTRLTAIPVVDMSEGAAASALEPLLRAWAARIEIETRLVVHFRDAGRGVDEGSPAHRRYVESGPSVVVSATPRAPSAPRTVTSLPPPVARFAETPQLRELEKRIDEYREGRDRLLAVGYYAYTTFTGAFGGRRQAPAHMNVCSSVLETLNRLTSRVHPEHGRKALDPAQTPPLSNQEARWVETALVLLTLRMGEVQARAADLPLITMKDLPPL